MKILRTGKQGKHFRYIDIVKFLGQDDVNGRRQLIPITEGELKGEDLNGNPIHGVCLPGGVDSQVIRPNGICELSARYGAPVILLYNRGQGLIG